ncbi:MAG: hypothetical protein ACRDWS_05475 [Acidimicrobiia bacterium]
MITKAVAKPGTRLARIALVALAAVMVLWLAGLILVGLWITGQLLPPMTLTEVLILIVPFVTAGALIGISTLPSRKSLRIGLLVVPAAYLFLVGLLSFPIGIIFLLPAGLALASMVEIVRSDDTRVEQGRPPTLG